MKRLLIYIYIAVLSFALLFSACSNKGAESEKGAIEEFTEETGKAVAESIKRPIDRARALQEKSAEKVEASDSLLDE